MEIFEIHPSLRLYIIPIAMLQRCDDTIRFYFFPLSSRCQNLSLKKKKNIENETFLSFQRSIVFVKTCRPILEKYNLCVLLK